MAQPAEIKTSDKASARQVLYELQVEQHHHDELYHREIARLSLHQRLNHMALHFAKYVGKLAGRTSDADTLPIYVDTLIIALSTANILNIELWDTLGHQGHEYPGLLAFGRALAHDKATVIGSRTEGLQEMAIVTGRVAAACEKIDHLEEIPFRAEISNGISKLATLALANICNGGTDPAYEVRKRLDQVKSRLKLHGRV